MISNYKQNLEKILEEERRAKEAITTAEIERDEILRKEREKIKKEIKEYEEEMKQNLKNEIAKLNATEVKQEESIKKINREMQTLKQESELAKSKVIEYILDNTLDVDLTIPDVIKGQFSAKLGSSK